MAKRKEAENFDVDEDELLNLFDDELSPPKKREVRTPVAAAASPRPKKRDVMTQAAAASSPPPKKRVRTPSEAWDAMEQQIAYLTESRTPMSELDKVPTMEDITGMPVEEGGTRKMRRTGKARKMKTKKSSKSRTRKSTRRRHKNRRTR
jgi:hypothetical protein